MNKIAIVGHPASGHQLIEKQLLGCGMAPPLPSRRDGLSPQAIAQALIKAHGCEPIEAVTDEAALYPLEAGPVWHGMALDLLLGNLDQTFWGWSDPNSLYLLDYWRGLDPQIVFVLVYDHPRSALLSWAETQQNGPNTTDARCALDNWMAYNGALLRFYLRHPERCVLVSLEQAQHAVDTYLQQMGQKLRRPLALPSSADTTALPVSPNLPAPLQAAAQVLGAQEQAFVELWSVPGVEHYLVGDVLEQHPAALQLFEELQSATSLPNVNRRTGKPDAEPAWEALLRHRQHVANTLAQLVELHDRRTAQVNELLAQAQSAQQTRVLELQAHQHTQTQTATLEKENNLLLQQLHQVQEELERQFLVHQNLRSAHKELEAERNNLVQKNAAQADAHNTAKQVLQGLQDQLKQTQADLVQTQQQLAQAVGNAQDQAARDANALSAQNEENELLLKQLHQVQEELERYYLENQKLKAAAAKPAKPRYYGAAERIKQQLTYRLGARVIQQNQTLWGRIWLLPALWKEARAFKRDQASRPEQKLPPISQYADAFEADRAKAHLSYKLGLVVLKAGYNPLKWPLLPFALKAEAKGWKQQQGQA